MSSETTPLISHSAGNGLQEAASAEESSSPDSQQSERLWKELDKPWPSTFERSIALLASPVQTRDNVEKFTHSPKPGSTPLALTKRTNLDKGFYTPERSAIYPPKRGENLSERDAGSFRQGLGKIQSLDFRPVDLESVVDIQKKKAQEAKEYRQKILQQSDQYKSPGYGREMASVRMKKKQKEAKKVEGKSSFMQCVFNLANILMGVGLLGLPYVLKSAGWIGGLFALTVLAVVAWRTSILIGRELNGDPRPSNFFDDSPFKTPVQPGSVPSARMYPPITSFPDIAKAAFGKTGNLVLSILLYFELFSCICVFLVTIGDHLHENFPTIQSTHLQAITAGVSMIPTIFLRTPTLLSYLSMVGTIATICVVLSVVMAAFLEGDISEQVGAKMGVERPFHVVWRSEGLILALGLVAYCFSGHAIVPSIYSSMERPQDFERMVTFTFIIVYISCVAVGVAGYYIFGSAVADQITLSLKQNSSADTAMKSLTWLMILTAFSKITLTMFPLAIGMEEIVAPYLTSERMVYLTSGFVKLSLTLLALVVAVFVPSFSFICALVGMICTMAVSVVFPAWAYVKMFWRQLSFADKAINIALVISGVILSIAGTIATVMQ